MSRLKSERLSAIHNRSLIFSSFGLLILFSWSCQRKVPASGPIPTRSPAGARIESAPPAITPPAITPARPDLLEAPLPTTITITSSFDLGEMNFRIGNYAEAANSYETCLNDPTSENRDRALYHLALARALAADSSRDLHQTEAALKKLKTEFPNSRYKNQAEVILDLLGQANKLRAEIRERDEKIKRLSEELQKLKDIDMQRRPTRE